MTFQTISLDNPILLALTNRKRLIFAQNVTKCCTEKAQPLFCIANEQCDLRAVP